MATQVCENLAMINSDDEVKGMEFLEINGALLLSLMEESQADESDDDDRLDSLIRSLEAEISGTTMDGCDSSSMEDEVASNGSQEGQSWNIGVIDGQDYWASSCDFEMECVNMDVMPCDGSSWCIDSYGGEMDGISDIFYVNNLKMDDGFAMGEHAYNSFWKESYN